MQQSNNGAGQAAILREMPISNNFQKSGGEMHCKVDRQNSFVWQGNRKGVAGGGLPNFGHGLRAQPQQL